MAVLLGGRGAERIIYGRLSTGAATELLKVKDVARSMTMRYGMEVKLGNLPYQLDSSPFLPTSDICAHRPERPPRRSTGRCARSRVERSSMPSPARKNARRPLRDLPACCPCPSPVAQDSERRIS